MWSGAFLTYLRSAVNLRPIYRLWIGAAYWGRSTRVRRSLDLRLIESASCGSQSLTPISWATQPGGFSVSVATRDPGALFDALRRGTLIGLEVGFPGWAESDYQRIALGRVTGISGIRGRYVISASDIFSGMVGRFAVRDPTEIQLFSSAGDTTYLTSNYVVGNSSIAVNDGSIFSKSSAHVGLVSVSDASGSNAFYLEVDSIAGNTLNLSSASIAGDVLATVRAGVTSGSGNSLVTALGYMRGHPVNIARRVLVSTGAATNGPYDVLPETWALGLDDQLLDRADIDAHKTAIALSSGTYQIHVIVDAPLEDGYSWLRNWLQPYGIFVAIRQGKITIRGAHNVRSPGVAYGWQITDQDVAEITGYDRWDRSVPVESAGIYVYDAISNDKTTSSYGVGSLPAVRWAKYDISATNLGSSKSVHRVEVRDRLVSWALIVPERLTLRLSGWRLSGVAVGDVVNVSIAGIFSKSGDHAGQWIDRPALVVGIALDFSAGHTIELSAPPRLADPRTR